MQQADTTIPGVKIVLEETVLGRLTAVLGAQICARLKSGRILSVIRLDEASVNCGKKSEYSDFCFLGEKKCVNSVR